MRPFRSWRERYHVRRRSLDVISTHDCPLRRIDEQEQVGILNGNGQQSSLGVEAQSVRSAKAAEVDHTSSLPRGEVHDGYRVSTVDVVGISKTAVVGHKSELAVGRKDHFVWDVAHRCAG